MTIVYIAQITEAVLLKALQDDEIKAIEATMQSPSKSGAGAGASALQSPQKAAAPTPQNTPAEKPKKAGKKPILKNPGAHFARCTLC